MDGWTLLLIVLSFISGFIFCRVLVFVSATSLSANLLRAANLACLYTFVKSFERITYYNNLALNDYIKSGASERNIEVYKNNLDEEMRLFKSRCVKTLVDSKPALFRKMVSFDDWPTAMLYLNENRDFVLQLYKGKDA
jgi:hypothetical protein